MTKYIKNKDGKFAGSIGDGKTRTPVSAPNRPEIAGHLDPNEARGQIISMAATMQQNFVHEEVHKGYENIDNCLNGSLPDWQMQEKIGRLVAMSTHLKEEKQYRQADVMAQLAHDSHLALWAKQSNEASVAEDEDEDVVVVEVDTAAMYRKSLADAKDAAWDDLSAVDADGEAIATRSFQAYQKYGSA